MSRIELFDAVKTQDGREGTVVHIYDQPGLPLAYEVEFGAEMELQTIAASEIKEVVWKAKAS